MAAGQRSTEGQGEECLVWQAGRQAGRTELCLSTGSAGFDRRVWSSSGRDRKEIEDEDDKGETVRVGGKADTVKGCVGGKSGHISKGPSQPQAKR